eukprot:11323829-Prorocentrum_lima.AAC.1
MATPVYQSLIKSRSSSKASSLSHLSASTSILSGPGALCVFREAIATFSSSLEKIESWMRTVSGI